MNLLQMYRMELTLQENLRINILDIDEPMVFISGDEFIVQENIVQIGTIQVEDPESREISYSLLGEMPLSLA